MQLFDCHVATIKAVIIQIKLNRFLVKKNSQELFQATLSVKYYSSKTRASLRNVFAFRDGFLFEITLANSVVFLSGF